MLWIKQHFHFLDQIMLKVVQKFLDNVFLHLIYQIKSCIYKFIPYFLAQLDFCMIFNKCIDMNESFFKNLVVAHNLVIFPSTFQSRFLYFLSRNFYLINFWLEKQSLVLISYDHQINLFNDLKYKGQKLLPYSDTSILLFLSLCFSFPSSLLSLS